MKSKTRLTVARISRESDIDGKYVGLADSSVYDGFDVGL